MKERGQMQILHHPKKYKDIPELHSRKKKNPSCKVHKQAPFCNRGQPNLLYSRTLANHV